MRRAEAGRGVEELAALPGDAEGAAEERLRRGRPEADDDARPERRQLAVEPGAAGGELGGFRRMRRLPRASLYLKSLTALLVT